MIPDSRPLDEIQPDFDAPLIAERVRSLFERNGIPRRRHAATISEYLHLSPSQAHRKIKGESPWTLVQIREIASAFDVSPGDLFQDVSDTDKLNCFGQNSIFVIGNDELPCIARIGSQTIAGDPSSAFVAIRTDNQWHIHRAEHAPAGMHYRVEKIEIDGRRPALDAPAVAILDDNSDAADELARSLRKRGFSTVPFYSIDALLASVENICFSGFILDWLIGHETARRCIEVIRDRHNIRSPIIILTAYMGHAEHMNTIAEMMTTYRIIGPYEKPARAPVIAAALEPFCNR
ncbi:helix-turn-helix domain-containing protein [Burkholderia pyrrocinia]|uniref:helix-turn-helix domain-containing protein n=1 Tax=Burkholderia pyrrocinia TaxID=60550 RepID=UPI00064BAFE1|nr:helix-turn-helix domain-containing protein [Burkholderia pyrrocinia]AKM02692.1 histidine kinase [Burkholderia pyrrocinia]